MNDVVNFRPEQSSMMSTQLVVQNNNNAEEYFTNIQLMQSRMIDEDECMTKHIEQPGPP